MLVNNRLIVSWKRPSCDDPYAESPARQRRRRDASPTFPKLIVARPLTDADDPATVLHGRVDRWVTAAASRRQVATNLIAGLVPRACGVTDPDMVRALEDRDQAMQRRAADLATHAIQWGQVWVHRLGFPPVEPAPRETWMEAVSTVAAYQERWAIGNDHRPLGPDDAAKTIEALGHRRRAQAAVERALHFAGAATAAAGTVSVGAAEPNREMGGGAVTVFVVVAALLMAWRALACLRRRGAPSWERSLGGPPLCR